VRALPRLCDFYPGICLKNEEKARKNLGQGSRRIPTHYKTYTHTHTSKQYQTTTLQSKTNAEQDTLKWNAPNTIRYPQYKATLMCISPLSPFLYYIIQLIFFPLIHNITYNMFINVLIWIHEVSHIFFGIIVNKNMTSINFIHHRLF